VVEVFPASLRRESELSPGLRRGCGESFFPDVSVGPAGLYQFLRVAWHKTATRKDRDLLLHHAVERRTVAYSPAIDRRLLSVRPRSSRTQLVLAIKGVGVSQPSAFLLRAQAHTTQAYAIPRKRCIICNGWVSLRPPAAQRKAKPEGIRDCRGADPGLNKFKSQAAAVCIPSPGTSMYPLQCRVTGRSGAKSNPHSRGRDGLHSMSISKSK